MGRKTPPPQVRALQALIACAAAMVLAAPALAQSGPSVEVVQTTSDLSQRLTRVGDLSFSNLRPRRGERVITIDGQDRGQLFRGVGAAMTDSSAWLLDTELSPAARRAVLTALFSRAGAHLNFLVVPMGASDFSATGQPYTYDDLPPGQTDPTLQRFSLAHDRAYVLPVLRQVVRINRGIEVFSTPWSPPAWMKSNDALTDWGSNGTVLPVYYRALARYFVKFIQGYARAGIRVQDIAPQNEPRARAVFPSSIFPEPAAADWITQDLAPALHAARLTTGIYGGNLALGAHSYVDQLLAGPAGAVLRGIAWHCYGGVTRHNPMQTVASLAPGADQIMTECAPQLVPIPVSEIVMESIRSGASAVSLWNVALDPSGGPVEPPNAGCAGCRGVVTINPGTHSASYNLGYYQLAQFGRFVAPGAVRLTSNQFVSYFRHGRRWGITPGLDDVAFVNPDHTRVLVAYNNSNAHTALAVRWRGRTLEYVLRPRATVTFAWAPESFER